MAENEIVAFEQRLEAEKDSIIERLPKVNDWLTPERWYSVVRGLIKRGKFYPVIKKNPDSLIDAIKDLATWGLEPDDDEAFINVYQDRAQAQAMYKGLIRRSIETGVMRHLVADVIREGDSIEEFIDSEGRHLKHTRAFNKAPNRKLIGAYALFWLPNGLMDYELFDEDDIAACKAASMRQAGKETPAYRNTPGEMAKKSVLRRGLKRMRGKRDDNFARMVEAQQHFDAETTADNVGELPEDEMPQAELPQPDSQDVPCSRLLEDEAAAPEVVADAEFREVDEVEGKAQQSVSKDAAAAPMGEDRPLTKEEIGMLHSLSKGKAMNVFRAVGDFAKMKHSQLEAVMAKIQQL